MIEDIVIALLEVLEKNDKLREALVEYVHARAKSERALADWRDRRK